MSLLIDALKKAEQEKKEAAKRLKEAQDKSGGHYKLEDPTNRESDSKPDADVKAVNKPALELEDSTDRKTDPTGENEILASGDDAADDEAAAETDAAREPTVAGPMELSLEKSADDTLQQPENNDDDGNDFDDEITPGKKDETFAPTSLSLEDNNAAPSLDETARHVADDTRSETLSDSRYGRSFVSAEALARDMGGGREVPTPVAAQTVFSAVARSSERRQFLEWMVFLGLVTAIIIATGAFYYLKVTPLTPETSSPLVAKGVEAGTGQTIDIDMPAVAEEPVVSAEIDTPQPAAETAVAVATATQPAGAPATTAAEQEPSVVTAADKPAAATADTEISEAEPEPAAPADTEETDTVVARETLPEQIPLDQSAIAISRSRSVSKQDQLINSAYAAYTGGDYARAEADYSQVLAYRPGNRDALLGMAAIAYRRGNTQSAFEYYLELLKQFPKDPVARAAIINLQGNTDPVRSESTLKQMIAENPGASWLHFILGNVYAGSGRWADAQQAFFEAYRLQPQNPDYAYNLAVSLDHLGQARAANDYYKTALELADTNQTSFNTAAVIGRINSLSAATDKR